MALTPRKYQEELFERAKAENTIICADTGTGKTLVAVSLIRHFTQQPEDASQNQKLGRLLGKRLVCFVVPTVSLVQQQSAYIATQLALRVARFSSAEGVDDWQKQEWLDKINEADVIVMTAAILQKMLEHGYVSVADIQLLIFDEAHHATKAHPYKQIMDIYHRFKSEQPDTASLPHILGLTASPIHRAQHAAHSIKVLEQNLDATLVEVKLHKAELLAATQRPSITYLMHLDAPLQTGGTGFLGSRPQVLQQFLKLLRFDSSEVCRFLRIHQELGSLAQDVLALVYLETHMASLQLLRTQVESQTLQDLAAHLQRYVASVAIDASNTSDKVLRLLDHLEQQHKKRLAASAASMLIFVTQRDHCVVLAKLLSLSPRVASMLRVSWLVGQSSSTVGGGNDSKLKGHTPTEHKRVMADFRAGALNCLVVTQVAEEGLDFKACSVVIRFDLPGTLTSLIQSRGRARAQHSQLILFCRDYGERSRIERFLEAEIASKAFYGQSRDVEDFESGSDDEDYGALGVYRPSATIPAQLGAHAALRLLHETCQLLPADEFTTLHKPDFEVLRKLNGFQASLSLPRMQWLEFNERFLQGTVQPSVKLAKAQVAFEAIKRLHHKGALDDHLMPVRILDQADCLDANGQLRDITHIAKQPREVQACIANPFGPLHAALHLNVVTLSFGHSRCLFALICGAPIVNVDDIHFALLGQNAVATVVTTKRLPWDCSSLAFRSLYDFTHALLQGTGDRRHEPSQNLWHLIAPLVPGSLEIDWKAVRALPRVVPDVQLGPLLWLKMNRRLQPSRFCTFVKRRPDLSLDGPIPPDTPMFTFQSQMKRFPSLRHWYQAGSNPAGPGLCLEGLPENDQLVEVEILKPLRPDAQAGGQVAETAPTRLAAVLPASAFCQPYFDANLLAAASTLPFLTHHLFSQLQVQRALADFSLGPHIPAAMALQALTAPDCNSGRKDYETLEHVGDAFLKLAVSVHVFNNFDQENEGFLSKIRSNTTDNRALQKHASDIHLEKYLVTLRLASNHVDPPVFSGPDPTSDLAFTVRGKALADCVEALLGAAVTTRGMEAALSAAHNLGLSVGGPVPWTLRYSELPDSGLKGSPSVKELEGVLGYQFKRPKLLLDALRHRSAVSQQLATKEACYERLEFLGDSVIDCFITLRLYTLHSDAGPGQLTNLRAILVSNGSLGYIALHMLGLHQRILHNSPSLASRFDDAAAEIDIFQKEPYHQAVWFWDPVKVLCDVLEAIIGAILVDCDWNTDPVFSVLERLFEQPVAQLKRESPENPWTRLLQLRPPGCKKFEAVFATRAADEQSHCEILFHGASVGAARHQSSTVARAKAAFEAHVRLKQLYATKAELNAQCDCRKDRPE